MDSNVIAKHYDILINENNDPVHDPEPLKAYMDKWDGQDFINKMCLDNDKSILEIGVGTGRLAVRAAPLCKAFYGIDVSPKAIERAKENLKDYNNVLLICDDFLHHTFQCNFDVIYSSLTFMHIKEKQLAVDKIAQLLSCGGKLVLSIDKNQDKYIDIGTSRIKIYPDNPDGILKCFENSGLKLLEQYETEFAYIFVCSNFE